MKKWIAMLLAAIMLFSFAGCSAEEALDVVDMILQEVDDSLTYTVPVETTEPDTWDLPTDTTDSDDWDLPEETTEADFWDTPTETTEDWGDFTEATEGLDITEDVQIDDPETTPAETDYAETDFLDEDGTYSSRDDVALYIFQYGHLPNNYITKKQAESLGWPGGSLEPYAPGKCIGGSRFGNYEGLLPVKEGRFYTECDIDTLGAKSRGAKRIVFSNDGLIYYTDDHYASFTLLYGEE